MISPQMATDIVSPYPPTMQDLERKVEELEKELANLNSNYEFYRTSLNNLEARRDRLKEFTLANLDTDIPFEEIAEEIANIMLFDLTKEYYFDVTVRFTGTIEIGPGQDVEEVVQNMYFDMTDNHSDAQVSLDDITVDNVDIDEA